MAPTTTVPSSPPNPSDSRRRSALRQPSQAAPSSTQTPLQPHRKVSFNSPAEGSSPFSPAYKRVKIEKRKSTPRPASRNPSYTGPGGTGTLGVKDRLLQLAPEAPVSATPGREVFAPAWYARAVSREHPAVEDVDYTDEEEEEATPVPQNKRKITMSAPRREVSAAPSIITIPPCSSPPQQDTARVNISRTAMRRMNAQVTYPDKAPHTARQVQFDVRPPTEPKAMRQLKTLTAFERGVMRGLAAVNYQQGEWNDVFVGGETQQLHTGRPAQEERYTPYPKQTMGPSFSAVPASLARMPAFNRLVGKADDDKTPSRPAPANEMWSTKAIASTSPITTHNKMGFGNIFGNGVVPPQPPSGGIMFGSLSFGGQAGAPSVWGNTSTSPDSQMLTKWAGVTPFARHTSGSFIDTSGPLSPSPVFNRLATAEHPPTEPSIPPPAPSSSAFTRARTPSYQRLRPISISKPTPHRVSEGRITKGSAVAQLSTGLKTLRMMGADQRERMLLSMLQARQTTTTDDIGDDEVAVKQEEETNEGSIDMEISGDEVEPQEEGDLGVEAPSPATVPTGTYQGFTDSRLAEATIQYASPFPPTPPPPSPPSAQHDSPSPPKRYIPPHRRHLPPPPSELAFPKQRATRVPPPDKQWQPYGTIDRDIERMERNLERTEPPLYRRYVLEGGMSEEGYIEMVRGMQEEREARIVKKAMVGYDWVEVEDVAVGEGVVGYTGERTPEEPLQENQFPVAAPSKFPTSTYLEREEENLDVATAPVQLPRAARLRQTTTADHPLSWVLTELQAVQNRVQEIQDKVVAVARSTSSSTTTSSSSVVNDDDIEITIDPNSTATSNLNGDIKGKGWFMDYTLPSQADWTPTHTPRGDEKRGAPMPTFRNFSFAQIPEKGEGKGVMEWEEGSEGVWGELF